jgi:hypothetical protein
VDVFIEGMTDILKFAYRIDDPGKSRELQSLVAQTRQMRGGLIAWAS